MKLQTPYWFYSNCKNYCWDWIRLLCAECPLTKIWQPYPFLVIMSPLRKFTYEFSVSGAQASQEADLARKSTLMAPLFAYCIPMNFPIALHVSATPFSRTHPLRDKGICDRDPGIGPSDTFRFSAHHTSPNNKLKVPAKRFGVQEPSSLLMEVACRIKRRLIVTVKIMYDVWDEHMIRERRVWIFVTRLTQAAFEIR